MNIILVTAIWCPSCIIMRPRYQKLFEKFSIEDEKTNEVSTMLLTGLGTSKEKLLKLQYALQKLDKAI